MVSYFSIFNYCSRWDENPVRTVEEKTKEQDIHNCWHPCVAWVKNSTVPRGCSLSLRFETCAGGPKKRTAGKNEYLCTQNCAMGLEQCLEVARLGLGRQIENGQLGCRFCWLSLSGRCCGPLCPWLRRFSCLPSLRRNSTNSRGGGERGADKIPSHEI